MKIKYRMKRTTKQYIIVAIICIVIIGGASFLTTIFVTNQIKVEYKTLLIDANNDLKLNQRSVYVALNDITAGDLITKDKIKKEMVYSSQPQDYYITDDEIGQQALMDIPINTHIMTMMLTDNVISDELREVEYQIFNINANIVSNDTVDIRIFFPNGESFVVLSKKVIKGISEGTVMCYLWLDAEEILRMSAAIVDAALYPGTQLVTTKYIEPSIQVASEVTYVPSLSILELLETDPNILERSSQKLRIDVRKALENRLASNMSINVSTINWDLDTNREKEISLKEPVNKYKEYESGGSLKQKDGNGEGKVTEELGTNKETEYFYYADEQDAKESELEYGE